MLSLILLLVLVGIAAYFRSPAWLISLAAVVGLALGGAAWWAYPRAGYRSSLLPAACARFYPRPHFRHL